jgi:hypothetical protein
MEKTYLGSLFDFDSPSKSGIRRVEGGESSRTTEDEPSRVAGCTIPCPMNEDRLYEEETYG